MKPTCADRLDVDIHSANDFIEQSHDNGLSANDKLVSVFAVSNAFLATIEMSLPSMQSSCRDGNGAIRSADSVLYMKIMGPLI